MPTAAVSYSTAEHQDKAEQLAESLGLPCVSTMDATFPVYLLVTPEGLQLQASGDAAPGPVMVDFVQGALAHRRRFGGGRRQLIGRAVGITPKKHLTVLDVTAGLGRDAYLLSTLGCQVTMIEHSPVISAMLEDGLQRAHQQGEAISLTLIVMDSLQYMLALSPEMYPDVIYLDPMFPPLKKSAAVKKEMRVLRLLADQDDSAILLLQQAKKIAKKRVVVKRHRHMATMDGKPADLVFSGKSSRYDVYLTL